MNFEKTGTPHFFNYFFFQKREEKEEEEEKTIFIWLSRISQNI